MPRDEHHVSVGTKQMDLKVHMLPQRQVVMPDVGCLGYACQADQGIHRMVTEVQVHRKVSTTTSNVQIGSGAGRPHRQRLRIVCTHVSELVASHESRCPKCMQRKEMFPISEGVRPNLHCHRGTGVHQNIYLFQNPGDANLSLWPGRPRTTKRIQFITSTRTGDQAQSLQCRRPWQTQ